MNYYISDLHFGHANVIRFDNRPWQTIEEMNEALIENWNSAVTKNDDVYILGDFHWGKKDDWISILKRLNGRKHLIRGNHDLKDYPSDLKKYFVSVTDYARIKDNGRTVALCHFPMPIFNGIYKGHYHLYGHVHTTEDNPMTDSFIETVCAYYEQPRRAFNVGCMMPWMEYRPRTLTEIEDGFNSYRRFVKHEISS